MQIQKEFPSCPACGSQDRFFETLTKEVKEAGFAREEWDFHYDLKQGAIVDKVKEPSIPVGSEAPGYLIKTDICLNCGCVYATELNSTPVKKSLATPKLVRPDGMPKGMSFNDPRFS